MADIPTVDESGERWYPSAFVATQHSMIRAAIAERDAARAERDAARAERDAMNADAAVGALVRALPERLAIQRTASGDFVAFLPSLGENQFVLLRRDPADALRDAQEIKAPRG